MPCGPHVVISEILGWGDPGFPQRVVVILFLHPLWAIFCDLLRMFQMACADYSISCCVDRIASLSKLCLFLFGCVFWLCGVFVFFWFLCFCCCVFVLFVLIHRQPTGLCKGSLALFCSHPMRRLSIISQFIYGKNKPVLRPGESHEGVGWKKTENFTVVTRKSLTNRFEVLGLNLSTAEKKN